MKQKELYIRDINKDIDGVVKAADMSDETLHNEMVEYILTDELMGANMLPLLFGELSDPDFKKSIWISGYFGSGKSHLLKILSIVLSNRIVLGESCADILASKVVNDFELAGDIKRATSIPTESILFNIQNKSDGIAQQNADPVLTVFIKVFNEHLGYSDNPKVASFERYLDDKGEYTRFKQTYLERFAKDWEQDRKHLTLNPSRCAEIFSEIEGISIEEAKDGVKSFLRDFTLDTTTFAELIVQHLSKQAPNSRLIFCVDEVGQYIAEDTSKMLSLQSITEEISVKTGGRALTIVTSQNDLTATVGDLKSEQKNDFSKITGRFAFKISLTSANADEVIQKRLLAKNYSAKSELSALYQKEQNNLKTLLQFGGDTIFNITYKSEQHFVNTYPFLAYQFDLLQAAILELQKNNAFIGRHSSVGERSMLTICQKVAQHYADKNIDELINFGSMYNGLIGMFQGNITNDITQAEKLLGDELAINILKALFLSKYVKRISTTVDNIVVMMQPSFNVDLVAFKKEVQQALNVLEGKTYIQRSAAGVYEYLTNQEKDIENEIKNTEPEHGAYHKLIQGFLFDELYTTQKIQIGTHKYQLFEYGKKCDEGIVGQAKDIYLHFVTTLCDNVILRNNIINYSMANPADLFVVMPENDKLRSEIVLYKQTEKYLQSTHPAEHELLKINIRRDKQAKNSERRSIILQMLKDDLDASKVYYAGNESTLSANGGFKDKISGGLIGLIESKYTSLRMLQMDYSEDSILAAIKNSDSMVIESPMSEAETEVLSQLQRNKNSHERTTIKSLLAIFKTNSYGWYHNATLALVAQLYKRGKVSLTQNGTLLDDAAVILALTNSRSYEGTIIAIESQIDNSQISKLKQFFQDYFGKSATKNEARELHKLVADEMASFSTIVEGYYMQRSDYPFLESLKAPLDRIAKIKNLPYPHIFSELKDFEDDMLDDKEDILDPIVAFMKGAQLSILKKIGSYIRSNSANLNYLTEGHIEKLQQVYKSPAPYKGGVMQEANKALEAMQQELQSLLQSTRERCLAEVNKYKEQLSSFADFAELSATEQQELLKGFDKITTDITENHYIANMNEASTKTAGDYYQNCIIRMKGWIASKNQPQDDNTETPEPKRITYIRKASVSVDFSKPSLDTKEDVEDYLAKLKTKYISIIEDEKHILL